MIIKLFSNEAFMLSNQKLNFLFDKKKIRGGGWQETINFIKGVSRGGGRLGVSLGTLLILSNLNYRGYIKRTLISLSNKTYNIFPYSSVMHIN